MRALPKLFAVLAIAAALCAATLLWLDVVQTLRHSKPVVAPKGPPVPSGILWGDRVFRSPRELERWLHSRGASYSRWRRRFPDEARVLEHRPPLSTTSPSVTRAAARARRRADAATTKKAAGHTEATKADRAASPVAAGSRRDLLLWVVIVAAGGALVAMVARVLRHPHP